jgi:methylmalonyl-CoA mutase
MRRLLHAQGAEVIHLGHNRSVSEIVAAAVQEDAQGVAVSSYQGGHVEFFTYLLQALAAAGRPDLRVYGGGGGVIVPDEAAALEAAGVRHIFTPADGQRLGLPAMVNQIVADSDFPPEPATAADVARSGEPGLDGQRHLARILSSIERHEADASLRAALDQAAAGRAGRSPVLGITGTGGSGKSSLTDELIRRLRLDQHDHLRIAVLAVDPSRQRGGGALLGDRIRMNALDPATVYFRSLASRGATGLPAYLPDAVTACRAAGYDLVIVETPGIGQADASIAGVAGLYLYVMTPEFGAPTQLEKIEMLEVADLVAINKFDRRGAADAFRDVRRQLARRDDLFGSDPETLPVFGTIAARFNDDGVTALYQELRIRLAAGGLPIDARPGLPPVAVRCSSHAQAHIPSDRVRYLAEIASTVRQYHDQTDRQAATARARQQSLATAEALRGAGQPSADVEALAAQAEGELSAESRQLLAGWPDLQAEHRGTRRSMSGTEVPRVAVPHFVDEGERLRWLRRENAPGRFPFTAGVFAHRRSGEGPTRMFAGEGAPSRTNRRFHLLAEGQPATRLSTAFDSVTLYGFDPDTRPDIYGKVGNSGVSVATVENMAELYRGFDLSDPSTSVSMTINGPAPAILAMFFAAVVDQAVERFETETGRAASAEERGALGADALHRVRGTVQADILKEDQGQNTCIFSTDFALRMMGDIQEWFVANRVDNFYSVSISGYHIAEAGANPITQLAFTLANAFTYVETYLARGMQIDDFAPSLSFFFSNGLDPEYSVIGRVARRIWAIAMRERYGAAERSQKLKYHVQTSGRSLHAQEMAFNDIRTTLEALYAMSDNANSLHTNAYDEAVTTPTDESVRRALAIQLIIAKEYGLTANENPLQGSFVIEELTDAVEAAVLDELDRLSERGGVLGAMETGYQRGRIQDESARYEMAKHDGTLPLVGVNTFVAPGGGRVIGPQALTRSTPEERDGQVAHVNEFRRRHDQERPYALARLRDAALAGDNIFAVLVDVVRCCTLGDITETLFEVGGRYRRNL